MSIINNKEEFGKEKPKRRYIDSKEFLKETIGTLRELRKNKAPDVSFIIKNNNTIEFKKTKIL